MDEDEDAEDEEDEKEVEEEEEGEEEKVEEVEREEDEEEDVTHLLSGTADLDVQGPPDCCQGYSPCRCDVARSTIVAPPVSANLQGN
jgi:hypothetical protein